MKIPALLLLTALSMSASAQQPGPPAVFVNSLMPQPARLAEQSGALPISANWTIATAKFHDQRLDAAISRALSELTFRTGVELPRKAAPSLPNPTLLIDVDGPGQVVQSLDENESYSLRISPASAQLHAATDVGAMRGLATLVQLVQPDGNHGYFLPAVNIEDTPRFRWRGLMIDCSRHFVPIPVLQRTLDGMAAVKLNVFHWHLSDDQGFRMESKVFPKLTSLGSDGLYYTQDQARALVAYARARGIRVVPEFDMPGHAGSWLAGYPDLASGPGPFHIERRFGIFNPVLDPTRDSTYQFLDRFIGEMAAIFPDPYFHIGGDENNGKEWKANPRIQEFMRQHNLSGTAALQNYFNERLLPILQKHGKRMIGWDEVLTPGLPKDVTVQSWRGFDSLAAGAKQGYAGILSAGYYLDHMDSAGTHYLVDPLPANNGLTPEQQARILGGEVCMWSEQVDATNIDSRIWPRTAAIAERLWSPQSVNNVDDMYRRLWVESVRLEAVGLTHISQQDASLRQLAGSAPLATSGAATAPISSADPIAPLRVLASVLEPPDFDTRDAYVEQHHITQLTPLDHLVDAVRPDPPSGHDLALLVRDYLQSPREHPQDQARLAALFQSWTDTEAPALRLISTAPLLANAAPRVHQLAELGKIGSQALTFLNSGKAAPVGWKAASLAALDDASKVSAVTRFTVIGPLRDLVNATLEGQQP
jgi:hexosaminidase